MTPTIGTTLWLVSLTVLVLALQGLVIGILVCRSLWADFILRRHRRRTHLLNKIYDELRADQSAPMRRALAKREILRDAQQMDGWLDLVATHGADPADIPAVRYEQAALVTKYTEQLQQKKSWAGRAAAAEMLGWTRSALAVEPLLDCALDLCHEPVAVRSVALRALGRIRHPDATQKLVPSLASSETWLPPLVANCLVRIGRPCVPSVAEVVQDVDQPITMRRWAAQILGDVGDPRAVITLHEALSDVDAELRARAAAALGEICVERSIDPLLNCLLVDPIPFVRVRVARALGKLSTPRTVDFLIEALGDSEWWVRLRAVEALAQIGDPAQEILASTLHDRNPAVARESARALESLGRVRDAIRQLLREDYDPHAMEFLIDVGMAGNIEPLLDELDTEDTGAVIKIVRVLARIGDPRCAPALARLLERSQPTALLIRIVDALRRCGGTDYVQSMLPLLSSEDEWVRTETIECLCELADTNVLPAVLPLVHDESPSARESALRLVERMKPGPEVRPVVAPCLTDPVPAVRTQALRTLCACEGLEEILGSTILLELEDAEIRAALLDGLTDSATLQSIPILGQVFEKLTDGELDRAAAILSDASEYGDVTAALRQLDDLEGSASPIAIRWMRAVLLYQLANESGETQLLELWNDPDSRVRAAAVFSLRGSSTRASIQVLFDAIAGASPAVARAALRALGFRPREDGERHIIERMRCEESSCRVEAVFALARYASVAALEGLRCAAESQDHEVRSAALFSLTFAGDEDALRNWLICLEDEKTAPVIAGWHSVRHPAIEHMLAAARDDSSSLHEKLLLCTSAFEAERVLIDALDSSTDHETRCLALQGLGALSSLRPAGRVLSVHRRDPSPTVRAAALTYVVRKNVFGRRVQFLDDALRDPVESIQIQAVELTKTLERHETVSLLLPRLDTRRERLLHTLADVLATIMSEDPAAIMDVFMGQAWKPDQMLGMIQVLRRVSAPLTVEILEALLRHRRAKIRVEAVSALVPRLHADGLKYLRLAMADPSAMVRERAIRCLRSPAVQGEKRTRTEAGRLALDATFDASPIVRGRAALVLADLQPQGVKRVLNRLRQDPNPRVVRRAERALEMLRTQREEMLL